jgi:hypothetical protein
MMRDSESIILRMHQLLEIAVIILSAHQAKRPIPSKINFIPSEFRTQFLIPRAKISNSKSQEITSSHNSTCSRSRARRTGRSVLDRQFDGCEINSQSECPIYLMSVSFGSVGPTVQHYLYLEVRRPTEPATDSNLLFLWLGLRLANQNIGPMSKCKCPHASGTR